MRARICASRMPFYASAMRACDIDDASRVPFCISAMRARNIYIASQEPFGMIVADHPGLLLKPFYDYIGIMLSMCMYVCMYACICPTRSTSGGSTSSSVEESECAMRREHRRGPILKLGVLVHAFVAAAGVLQSGKLTLCNFVIKIAESFLQFLNSWMREKFARKKFAREKFAR